MEAQPRRPNCAQAAAQGAARGAYVGLVLGILWGVWEEKKFVFRNCLKVRRGAAAAEARPRRCLSRR
jgi:hypothetical protein